MDRLLSGREVADVLGVTPRTIRNYARRGELSRIRLSGKCSRYSSAEVAALIASRTETTERPAATPSAQRKRVAPRHEPE
jgi:excisionase family DNA binding protein